MKRNYTHVFVGFWILIILLIAVSCWPEPAESNETPDFRVVTSSNLPITHLWSVSLDKLLVTIPIVTDSIVVVSIDTSLFGLSSSTGDKIWQHDFDNTQVSNSPYPIEVEGDFLVYGDRDGQINALRISSGELLWQHKLCNSYRTTSIVIDNTSVYVASQPTTVSSLNLTSGELQWSLCNRDYALPGRSAELFLEDGNLFLTTSELHLLDPATGEIVQHWPFYIGNAAQFEDGIFYGSNWFRMMGGTLNSRSFTGLGNLSSPSYKPLYGACEAFRPPYTFDESQFFGVGYCGGVFSMTQQTNNIIWEYRSEADAISPMEIYKGDLYVLFSDGELHAIQRDDGQLLGFLKFSSSVQGLVSSGSGLSTNGSMLVVSFGDNTVSAFE